MNNLHLTAQQIRIFEAVARLKNITKAAEELHLSQPAVSIQLKRIEENNEVKLIEVVGKKLFLTRSGEHMYKSCQKILDELKELKLNISEEQGEVSGELNIAVVTPVKYFIAYILKHFLTRHPLVIPQITVLNRSNILAEFKNNAFDLAIIGRAPEEFKVESFPFCKNELVIAAPPKHPLSKKHNVTLEEIANERIIFRESGSGNRIAFEEVLASKGITVNPYMVMSSTESIKQAVMAGLGISILPKQAIRIEAKYRHLEILDVEGFPLMRDWYACQLPEKSLPLPAKEFVKFLKSVDIDKLLSMSDIR
ncbi:LysR family transcriptional regulator [Thiosulfativibrio zosterae]|uniref:LysR family transcriptional regulator n=1 Tax=Thiosulfativibrio zosterae TaxID=2675053 RepID=A0A6F8PQJ1_9GAMM|nr:LysR family transcriptional regulator [Thiosulfativibrio zosterae]BBP44393.1 LysR family transcriptional regulator [Thiosulfativibrio zosterae]